MTDVVFQTIEHLTADLVLRADTFARSVAFLNRNRNHLGEPHAHVALVTDTVPLVQQRDPNVADGEVGTCVGMCWSGGYASRRDTLIWVNPFYGDTILSKIARPKIDVVRTLVHELAHAYTRGQHTRTWRRMYALLLPHLMPLFEVEYRDRDVESMVRRYAVATCWSRQTAEWYEHMYAQERMSNRLERMKIQP